MDKPKSGEHENSLSQQETPKEQLIQMLPVSTATPPTQAAQKQSSILQSQDYSNPYLTLGSRPIKKDAEATDSAGKGPGEPAEGDSGQKGADGFAFLSQVEEVPGTGPPKDGGNFRKRKASLNSQYSKGSGGSKKGPIQSTA